MFRKLTFFLYFLLGINFLYVFSGALLLPMESVDVVGIWMFKTKAFFVEGGFPLATLKNPDFLLFHPQYPLLLPAAYSLVYFLMGQVWELPLLLLYPLYYLAILFLIWKVARNQGISEFKSVLYVYIYSMFSPLVGQAGRGHAGSADIVIVLLAWLAIVVFQAQYSPFNKGLWILLITMIASQIKLEGLFLGALLLVLDVSFTKKTLLSFLAFIPTLVWALIVKWLQIPTDFTFIFPGFIELGLRIWLIFKWTLLEMINIKNWYFFWVLFWLAMVATKTFENNFIKKLALASMLITGAYGLVYLTVTTNMEAHISSSIDRVLFHVTPFLYPIFMVKSQSILRKLIS